MSIAPGSKWAPEKVTDASLPDQSNLGKAQRTEHGKAKTAVDPKFAPQTVTENDLEDQSVMGKAQRAAAKLAGPTGPT